MRTAAASAALLAFFCCFCSAACSSCPLLLLPFHCPNQTRCDSLTNSDCQSLLQESSLLSREGACAVSSTSTCSSVLSCRKTAYNAC
jgi:hypothetical protein